VTTSTIELPPVAPLVAVSDLVGFRGAPFPAAVTQAAAESVRSECGWHIAPRIEQTIMVRTGGGDTVLLPSLQVAEVASVTDRAGAAVDGWEVWSNGILERPGGFPRTIVVTFTHGYTACPKDLLGIIAERASAQAAGRVKAESLAGRSVQLDGGYDPLTQTIINAYRLTGG